MRSPCADHYTEQFRPDGAIFTIDFLPRIIHSLIIGLVFSSAQFTNTFDGPYFMAITLTMIRMSVPRYKRINCAILPSLSSSES